MFSYQVFDQIRNYEAVGYFLLTIMFNINRGFQSSKTYTAGFDSALREALTDDTRGFVSLSIYVHC